MKIEELVREFRYNGVILPDPNADFSIEQVREFYSAVHPEILNADIEGPDVKGNKHVYTFRRAVGTKGSEQDPAPNRFWTHATISTQIKDLGALMDIGWFDEADAAIIKDMQERIAMPGAFVFPSTDLIAKCLRVLDLHRDHCSRDGVCA